MELETYWLTECRMYGWPQSRDLLVDLGCAIRTLRRLSRRLDVLRWCLIDVHLSAFCIDARAVLERRY
jgi:hypothetical protein